MRRFAKDGVTMITSILIDQREPDHVKAMTFDGAPTVTTLLEHGDLQVLCDDGELLVIERKTPSDLLNSIRDERLLAQVAEVCSVEGGWPYLLIHGQLTKGQSGCVVADGRETGWKWAALQGLLLTVQEMGCFVVTGDDLERTVINLAERNRSKIVRVHPRRAAIFATPAEQVLASLPGIGEDKASTLLSNHNGNLTWALCSLLDPEWNQPGVGPKTRETLRTLFCLREGETLWPMSKEDQPLQKETIS